MSDKERPATISFGGGGNEQEADMGLEIEVADPDANDESIDSVAQHRVGAKGTKKPGFPAWIFPLVGAVFLLLVGTVGFVIYKKSQASQMEDVPVAMAPQPSFQAEPPASVATPAQAQQPTALTPVAQPEVAPEPVQMQQPVMQAAPQPNVVQPVQQGVATDLTAKQLVALDAALLKLNAAVDDLNKQMADTTKRLAKLESANVAKPAQAAPAAAAHPQAAVKPATAVTQHTTQASAKSQTAPVATNTRSPTKPQAKPAAETAAAPPAQVQGYTVSSLIGNRVWLVKQNSDGSEQELSAAVGEKIEGRAVTAVDFASKCLSLDNGQRICVGR